MDFCGLKYCDFIKELQRRHMNDITESILCSLDVHSIQNVRLVSKVWCKAVSDGKDKIWRTILNNGWGVEFSSLWQRLRRHLSVDFPIRLDHAFYCQRLCNTTQLAHDGMSKTVGCNFSINYLPYRRNLNLLVSCGQHLEINEKFIVAWDSSVNQMKFWSRRFMKRLPLDQDFSQCDTPSGPGLNFCLHHQFLLTGGLIGYQGFDEELKSGEELNYAEHLCLFDLAEKGAYKGSRSGMPSRNPEEIFFDTSHLGTVGQYMRYIDVQDRFHMIVFSHRRERTNLRVIVWKMNDLMGEPLPSLAGGRFKIGKPWKTLTVPFTPKNHFFVDAIYLIVHGRERSSESTFLVYSMLEREVGQPKLVNRLEFKGAKQYQFYKGMLVTAFTNGVIRFVDVKSGITMRQMETLIDFSAPGSLIRLENSSSFFVICSASPVHGTDFQIWNLDDPNSVADEPLNCFNAFTGRVVDFKYDGLGIVAVMETDGDHGIQVAHFVPHCGSCKLIFPKDRLKRCGNCKLVKYCSTNCQRTDWNHHKTICSKLIPSL